MSGALNSVQKKFEALDCLAVCSVFEEKPNCTKILYIECHYAQCSYTECLNLLIVMLNVIVVRKVMLNFVMLSVIVLNAVAPIYHLQ